MWFYVIAINRFLPREFAISEISFDGSAKLRTIKIDAKFTKLSLGIACAHEPT